MFGTSAGPLGLTGCSLLGSLPGVAGDAAKTARGCQDVSTYAAAVKVDFEKEFDLDAKAAAKIKAGVIAAAELSKLADELDAQLMVGCKGLATDLGAGAEFQTGREACKGALVALGEAKGRLGANASVTLDVVPPRCSISMNAMTDCAAKCDTKVEAGKVEAKCEGGEISGVCKGACTGSCELETAGSCAGTCEGACSADFSGQCGGDCSGTCDGEESSGACSGKCEGECSADAVGSCGGGCEGSCELEAEAECKGRCTGSCSVEFEAPQCSGEVVPPKMSADCKGSCEAHAAVSTVCTKPELAVTVTGEATLEVERLKVALEKNLPILIQVAVSLGPKVKDLVVQGKAVVEGGIKTIEAAKDHRPSAGARLAGCLMKPYGAALTATSNIKASVNLSVDIKASASAEASAEDETVASK